MEKLPVNYHPPTTKNTKITTHLAQKTPKFAKQWLHEWVRGREGWSSVTQLRAPRGRTRCPRWRSLLLVHHTWWSPHRARGTCLGALARRQRAHQRPLGRVGGVACCECVHVGRSLELYFTSVLGIVLVYSVTDIFPNRTKPRNGVRVRALCRFSARTQGL